MTESAVRSVVPCNFIICKVNGKPKYHPNRPMMNKMLHQTPNTIIYIQSHHQTLLVRNECAVNLVDSPRVMNQGPVVKADDILNTSSVITSTGVCSSLIGVDSIRFHSIVLIYTYLTTTIHVTHQKYCTIDNLLFHLISNSTLLLLLLLLLYYLTPTIILTTSPFNYFGQSMLQFKSITQ